MSGQNWRTEVDASDYLGHQKKRLDLDQRRPVIRKASDLVGPGIASGAVRISDFNNELATFNGYYSSEIGATSAPTPDEAFTGFVVSDAALGGTQTFTGLDTGFQYTRTFNRNPSDPTSISWSVWRGTERVPASAMANVSTSTSVPSGGGHQLTPPTLHTIGLAGTYLGDDDAVNVLRSGVYTGYLRVTGPSSLVLTVSTEWPKLNGTKVTSLVGVNITSGLWVPFTFWTTADLQQIRVAVQHAAGSDQNITWSDFSITRIGDLT